MGFSQRRSLNSLEYQLETQLCPGAEYKIWMPVWWHLLQHTPLGASRASENRGSWKPERKELWAALPLSKQCSAPNMPFRFSAQSLDPSLFLGSERAFLVKQGGFLVDPLFPHLLSHQLQIFGSIFLPE